MSMAFSWSGDAADLLVNLLSEVLIYKVIKKLCSLYSDYTVMCIFWEIIRKRKITRVKWKWSKHYQPKPALLLCDYDGNFIFVVILNLSRTNKV